jgi:hypothetical protein
VELCIFFFLNFFVCLLEIFHVFLFESVHVFLF